MKTQYHNLSNEELESIIKEKEAYIDKFWNDATLEWQDYCGEVKKTNINEMYAERLLRKEPTYRDADEFDLECRITIEEFIAWCKYGYFCDSDGTGYYGNETQISDIYANPSHFYNKWNRTDFTHIYWYNK